jgi:ketosteroid isomerase-like protein
MQMAAAEPATRLGVAQILIQALENRDPDGVIAQLHQDIVLELPYPLVAGENTTGTRRQSGAAVHAYLRHSKELTASNRFYNVEWHTVEYGPVIFRADGECTLSDGRPYRNHYLFIFDIQDGKVIRWVEYLNPVIAALAFGAPLETIPA